MINKIIRTKCSLEIRWDARISLLIFPNFTNSKAGTLVAF